MAVELVAQTLAFDGADGDLYHSVDTLEFVYH